MKLEQELKEIRSETSREKQTLISQVTSAQGEKSELEFQLKNLRNTINQLRESKETEEIELRNQLQIERNKAQRSVEEYRLKYESIEDSLKEKERQLFLKDSEQDKQFALLKQKLDYYENLSRETSQKEKELTEELKNLKKDYMNQLKDSSSKNESCVRELRFKQDQQLQLISELEVHKHFNLYKPK